ncbi:type IX secretion system membrane protein PorP/SprF [Marinigracilibium pacificum]|uniref:Type IX secretion system membrane protein PorP/SprF n=1 Tax=Marinigracilibium pacificum TaxID=2729599 RepID=A0A848IVF7_9BACT|nr:type IX secretion system membrane protein PorP/SprF [Marinigracilibium pacificum]NMM47221.1 type IX secretion system membrane protein PorP/SprF [Marinigracilibium pacificum]
MKSLIYYILFIWISAPLVGQNIPFYSQDQRTMGLFNPALVALEDFTQVQVGYKMFYPKIPEAPQLISASIEFNLGSDLKESTQQLRVSDPDALLELADKGGVGLRHGINVAFQGFQEFGLFFNKAIASYNLQIPLNESIKISGGVQVEYLGVNMNPEKYKLRDEVNDQFYQSLLQSGSNSSYLNLGLGAALLGEDFFVGVGVSNVVSSPIGDEPIKDLEPQPMISANAAYFFRNLGNVELSPMVSFYHHEGLGDIFSGQVRLFYKEVGYFGVGGGNRTLVYVPIGLNITKFITANYTYSILDKDKSGLGTSNHEVFVLFAIGNRKETKRYNK